MVDIVALIKLLRPPLFISGFVASWALLVASGQWGTPTALYILLAVGFGNAGLTVYNEIFDVRQDRINKPHKPLPSGRVSVLTARNIASTFMVISMLFLLLVSMYHGLKYLAAGFVGYIAGVIYNVRGHRALLGNFCLGLTYLIAALLSTGFTMHEFCVAFAILTVAHNVLVQLQDVEADRAVFVKTFPTVYGDDLTQALAMLLSTIAAMLFYYNGYVFFTIPALIVFVCAYVGKWYEYGLRYGVRLLLLVGFILMGLGVKMQWWL